MFSTHFLRLVRCTVKLNSLTNKVTSPYLYADEMESHNSHSTLWKQVLKHHWQNLADYLDIPIPDLNWFLLASSYASFSFRADCGNSSMSQNNVFLNTWSEPGTVLSTSYVLTNVKDLNTSFCIRSE